MRRLRLRKRLFYLHAILMHISPGNCRAKEGNLEFKDAQVDHCFIMSHDHNIY